MKKFLSAVLAGAMVASMASMSVFAADVVENVGAAAFDINPADTLLIPVPTEVDYVIAKDTQSTPADVKVTITPDQFADSDLFGFKVKKEEGSKIVKSVKLVEKALGNATTRSNYIEVKFNEDQTDKEYKVELEFTFSSKSKAGDVINEEGGETPAKTYKLASGVKFVYDSKFYVSNKVEKSNDVEFVAGTKGIVAKPDKNEENEVLWTGDYGDIAKLTFDTDSDVKVYYPKLSTKWDSALAGQFADQDAFYYSFVGNPTISATARPVLTIFNPFVNEDEELTVDEEDIVVYEVVDGELVDVTAKFTIGEDEDGEYVLTTKTRTLGTYIVAEAAVVADEAVETPVEDGKAVPDTGR